MTDAVYNIYVYNRVIDQLGKKALFVQQDHSYQTIQVYHSIILHRHDNPLNECSPTACTTGNRLQRSTKNYSINPGLEKRGTSSITK